MDLAYWQMWVDEVIALEAICGENFRVGSCSALPGVKDVNGRMLAECNPVASVSLECELMVHVDVPEDGLQLAVEVDTSRIIERVAAEAAHAAEEPSTSTPSKLTLLPVGKPVQYLPPIVVHLELNQDYPSTAPPNATLSAMWLSPAMVSDLEGQLSLLWSQQGPGDPIIFTWQDWLRGDALRHLGVHDRLVLAEPAMAPQGEDTPEVSGRMAVQAQQLAAGLLRYNSNRDAEEFATTLWLCGICYDEVPGSKCSRLPECGHYYCQACLREHCRSQVREGAVDNLRCPTPSCRKQIPPYIVRELLPQAEFERWEQLVLQRTLDSMTDAAYCPRCSTLTLEESDRCAQCPKCLFVFCGLCLGSWHVGEPCMDTEARLRAARARSEVTGNLTAEGRAARAKVQERLRDELISLAVIKATSTPCPNCSTAIQKTVGCDHMTCYSCRASFCYRCGQPYSNHNYATCAKATPPALVYDPMAGERRVQEIQHLARVQAMREAERGGARVTRCPACAQRNVKEGRNNNAHCSSCSTPFCHLCRTVLRGKGTASAHFLNVCKQHTDN